MESKLTMHCLSVVSLYLSLSKLLIRPAEDFPLCDVPEEKNRQRNLSNILPFEEMNY